MESRSTCSVDGCSRVHRAKGLCDNHYRRERQMRLRREARAQRKATCAFCGDRIPVERVLRGPINFCSRDCKQKAHIASGAAAAAALRSYYRRRYGLTIEQVEAMRETGCQICGTTDWPGRHRQGHVDHDHRTGRVRGILCTNCNAGLGRFKDDPVLLRRAIDYLSE